MQRLKKMDQERFAEAIGTRLNLTAKPSESTRSPPFNETFGSSLRAQSKRPTPPDAEFYFE